jgi:hypothetical protein
MSLEGKAAATELRGKINRLDVLTIDAYAIAVLNGFEGTQEEWLASLKGEKGDRGDKGDKGERGEDGYTPVKGKDYYTEAEKQSLIDDIEHQVVGDIETDLDSIIAIQAELIGGDSV